MKRWPLRWKLAFYAASLGVVATIAGAATTWTVMRSAEIAAFDRRLALDAEELFRDVEHFEGGLASNQLVFQEKFVPLALRGRLLEIHGPGGELLYRSPNVRGSGLVGPGACEFSYSHHRGAKRAGRHILLAGPDGAYRRRHEAKSTRTEGTFCSEWSRPSRLSPGGDDRLHLGSAPGPRAGRGHSPGRGPHHGPQSRSAPARPAVSG